MTKEELIKNQFPNDEFLQSSVLQIVDKCIAELERENADQKYQLEKAKEIIKGLCDLIHYKHGYFHDEIIKAEQFLKEIEK